MSIADLIDLAVARLANLTMLRTAAATLGDTARIIVIDAEIAETETTLATLRTVE